jgi:hypothetical protein
VLEGKVRAELFDARVVLSGKTDLALGQADGTTAGKVLIDFKTGGFSPAHIDDLRFYALLETLKIGTPPRLLASYYLEAGPAPPRAGHHRAARGHVGPDHRRGDRDGRAAAPGPGATLSIRPQLPMVSHARPLRDRHGLRRRGRPDR